MRGMLLAAAGVVAVQSGGCTTLPTLDAATTLRSVTAEGKGVAMIGVAASRADGSNDCVQAATFELKPLSAPAGEKPKPIRFGGMMFGSPRPPQYLVLSPGEYGISRIDCTIMVSVGGGTSSHTTHISASDGGHVARFTIASGAVADVGILHIHSFHPGGDKTRPVDKLFDVTPHTPEQRADFAQTHPSLSTDMQTSLMQIGQRPTSDKRRTVCEAQRTVDATLFNPFGKKRRPPPSCALVDRPA